MPATEMTTGLPDGRTIAFTEHGDLSGYPIFFIHGNPGSRYVRHPDEAIPERLGVRIITPDRPGYGLSDFQPGRTLLDFPGDIESLAEALDLERFGVFGVSAGGPYVAACAARLSDRIRRAAIVSGAAPMNREGAYNGMQPAWRAAFQLAERLPEWLLRGVLWLQTRMSLRNPRRALNQLAGILSASDRELLKDPEIREGILARQAEAARRGVRGMAREAKILVSPWGFSPSEISIPVDLWYWEADPAVPIQMGYYLASLIPRAETHFFPNGGHLGVFAHWSEILAELRPDGALT